MFCGTLARSVCSEPDEPAAKRFAILAREPDLIVQSSAMHCVPVRTRVTCNLLHSASSEHPPENALTQRFLRLVVDGVEESGDGELDDDLMVHPALVPRTDRVSAERPSNVS